MAKERFDEEIRNALGKAMNGVRAEMDNNYIHDVTLNTKEMIPAFMLGCSKVMTSKGFNPAQVSHVNKEFNTTTKWKEAITKVNNTVLLSNTKSVKFGSQTMTRVGEIPRFASFRGVYILSSTPGQVILRFYNKQLPKNINKNDRKFGTFNRDYRAWVWNEWFDTNNVGPGTKGSLTDNSGMNRTEKGAVGRSSPFAHETTVGMGAMRELKSDFEMNQALQGPYEGVFGTDVKTLALWDAVKETLNVEWKEVTVLDRKTNTYILKRVVQGKIVAQPKNLANSQKEDWFNLRQDVLSTLGTFLEEAKPFGKPTAAEFSGSKTVKETMAKHAVDVIVRDIVKKNKKRGKKVKTNHKNFTKPKPRTSKAVTRKGKGVSLGAMGAVKAGMAVRKSPQKDKTDKVREFSKLQTLIQKRLPAEVRRNMGRPELINRTGVFSDSVQLVNLRRTKMGISGQYTYKLNPYATFESLGNRKWPAGYNPKPLIAKSIRNLAMQYTEDRLVSLRRI